MPGSAVRVCPPRGDAAMLFVLSLGVCVAGCGPTEDGPSRYHVAGTVQFEGKPVAFGTITFEPDTQQGNSGPQGFAQIRNGAFDTRQSGKGTVGGAMIAHITGFDAEPPKDAQDDEPGPAPLFSGYRLQLELPNADTTQDIQVPPEAARPAAETPRAPLGP